MAPRGMITMTAVLFCLILGLLSPAPAAMGSHSNKACCTRYSRKPIPFHRIMGYREQTIKEHCRIEAIIFYTVKKTEICATRKDEWVRKNLELLSSKLKKMSKPAAEEAVTKGKDGGTHIKNESGPFFNTTETYSNSTESFY